MSGASDLNSQELDAKPGDNKSHTLTTDNRANKSATGKKYKNDEEEWAEIYKTNNQLYKQEADFLKVKNQVKKQDFRSELDGQVKIKEARKLEEQEQVKIDAEQIKIRLEREEEKERKKLADAKAKIYYEKQLRDEQMKEIIKNRKFESKQAKNLDNYIVQNLKREKLEEDEERQRKRESDLVGMRKVLADNEVKRQKGIEQSKIERQENIRLQELYTKMVDQQEAQRAADFKAKEDRLNKIIEQGKNAKVVVVDEREKRQLMKLAKHEEKKEKRLNDLEAAKQEEIRRRKLENKEYLDQTG